MRQLVVHLRHDDQVRVLSGKRKCHFFHLHAIDVGERLLCRTLL